MHCAPHSRVARAQPQRGAPPRARRAQSAPSRVPLGLAQPAGGARACPHLRPTHPAHRLGTARALAPGSKEPICAHVLTVCRAAVAARGPSGSAERDRAPGETRRGLGSRGGKCWRLEREACTRARRQPGRRLPWRVLGAQLARRRGSSVAVHAHLRLAGSSLEAGSRQPGDRPGKWQGGQQRQHAMLARTPIRRQLGVIPIDEFDGEFLGMFYRSAVGRVLR